MSEQLIYSDISASIEDLYGQFTRNNISVSQKKWVNDVTQLNATNMNEIARGITGLQEAMRQEVSSIKSVLRDVVNRNAGWKSDPDGIGTAEIFNDYKENISSGQYSSASGHGTISVGNSQYVIGQYNIADVARDDDGNMLDESNAITSEVSAARPANTYAFIVGGGTEEIRRNLFTIDWYGKSHIAGEILVDSAATLGNSLTVAGPSVLQSTLEVGGETTLSKSLTVGETAIMNGVLSVSGDTELKSKLDVTGSVTLGNSLTVTGQTLLKSKLEVSDDTTVNGTLTATRDVKVGQNISMTGMNNAINILNGDVNVNGSVAKAVDDMKNSILGEGISETFDTLVEIQNWINGDGVNTAELTSEIAGLSKKVAVVRNIDLANGVGGTFTEVEGQRVFTSKACGIGSFAFGNRVQANGKYATALGEASNASAARAHTEGYATIARGRNSHAEGGMTIASNSSAHSEGFVTFVVDHGIRLASTVRADDTVITISNPKGYNLEVGDFIGFEGTDHREITKIDGNEITIQYPLGEHDVFPANGVTTDSEVRIVARRTTASGLGSHAEGNGTRASGEGSHSEGVATEAAGKGAHAEGSNSKVYSNYGHAEGQSTTVGKSGENPATFGVAAHAEGYLTEATGNQSHAEGNNSKATNSQAHAEGYYTEATGAQSHAEGTYTRAYKRSQHVQGRYNLEDTGETTVGSVKYGKYAHIIGNGKSATARSNAHTVDWDGNAWYSGNIYVGGTSQDNGAKRLPMIFSGTGTPNASLGQDGDIYIMYSTEVA